MAKSAARDESDDDDDGDESDMDGDARYGREKAGGVGAAGRPHKLEDDASLRPAAASASALAAFRLARSPSSGLGVDELSRCIRRGSIVAMAGCIAVRQPRALAGRASALWQADRKDAVVEAVVCRRGGGGGGGGGARSKKKKRWKRASGKKQAATAESRATMRATVMMMVIRRKDRNRRRGGGGGRERGRERRGSDGRGSRK
jgi:hypothetical protein